ncbi:hypothetical protein TWF173_002072 [Orbilia oligospora]|nr:hypothetical protein TWF173_002072 [Orbilia oligospora]
MSSLGDRKIDLRKKLTQTIAGILHQPEGSPPSTRVPQVIYREPLHALSQPDLHLPQLKGIPDSDSRLSELESVQQPSSSLQESVILPSASNILPTRSTPPETVPDDLGPSASYEGLFEQKSPDGDLDGFPGNVDEMALDPSERTQIEQGLECLKIEEPDEMIIITPISVNILENLSSQKSEKIIQKVELNDDKNTKMNTKDDIKEVEGQAKKQSESVDGVSTSNIAPANPIFLPPLTLIWDKKTDDVHANFHLAFKVPDTDTSSMERRQRLGLQIFSTVSNIIEATKLNIPHPQKEHLELFVNFVEFVMDALAEDMLLRLMEFGIRPSEDILKIFKALPDASSDVALERRMVSLVLSCMLQPLDKTDDALASIMLFFTKIWSFEHTLEKSNMTTTSRISHLLGSLVEMGTHLLVWKIASDSARKKYLGNPFQSSPDRVPYLELANPAYNTVFGMLGRSTDHLLSETRLSWSRPTDTDTLKNCFQELTQRLLRKLINNCSGSDTSDILNSLVQLESIPADNTDMWSAFVKGNPTFQSDPCQKAFDSQLSLCHEFEILLLISSMLYLGETPGRMMRLVAENGSLLSSNIFFRNNRIHLIWKDEKIIIRGLSLMMSAAWNFYVRIIRPFKSKLCTFTSRFQIMDQMPERLDPQPIFRDHYYRPYTISHIEGIVQDAMGDSNLSIYDMIRGSIAWRRSLGLWMDGNQNWHEALTLNDISQLEFPSDTTGDLWFSILYQKD